MGRYYRTELKMAVAVSCIIFGYDTITRKLCVILVNRDSGPAGGRWSLPQKYIISDESLKEAASQLVTRFTSLEQQYLKQSAAWETVAQADNEREVTVSYYGVVSLNTIDHELLESGSAAWINSSELPEMIPGHGRMIRRALKDLRVRIREKPVIFSLLPEKFTLVQLQELYEAIYLCNVDKRNFRKMALSMHLLEKLEETDKSNSKKGAYYYRFRNAEYMELKNMGFTYKLYIR